MEAILHFRGGYTTFSWRLYYVIPIFMSIPTRVVVEFGCDNLCQMNVHWFLDGSMTLLPGFASVCLLVTAHKYIFILFQHMDARGWNQEFRAMPEEDRERYWVEAQYRGSPQIKSEGSVGCGTSD